MFVYVKMSPDGPSQISIAVLNISSVERETGIPKETLRVWERRYGFPRPHRTGTDDRAYSDAHIRKLRLVRRLMDSGLRPGALLGQSVDALERLAAERAGRRELNEGARVEVAAMMRALRAADVVEIRHRLQWQLARMGIQGFVALLTELMSAVGDAWLAGEISVADEHLFSQQAETVLRSAIGQMGWGPERPRVALATVPGEGHGLPLLFIEAILTAEHSGCLMLGPQLPIVDIVSAQRQYRADVIGLSFSVAFPLRHAVAMLAELRAQLPSAVEIWAGGSGLARRRSRVEGVAMPLDAASVLEELRRWRAENRAA
jgi:MerR family transcriptional regulator, light-induced transcriptional regulator